MENARHFLLLRGVKSLLRCDDAAVVSGIARYVVSQHKSLRLLSALIERTPNTPIPALLALIGGLVSFLEVRSSKNPRGIVWIARLGQERRAIQPLIEESSPLLANTDWTEVQFRRRPYLAALSAPLAGLMLGLTQIRRVFKLARRLHRRFEFFKVLRIIELIAYYTRFRETFEHGSAALAITSNHSNPHGIAFNLAAQKCGVPVVLISHGMPVRPVAKLAYDLAMVHCEAARQTYFSEGCQLKNVLVHGRRDDYSPMAAGPLPKQLTVGIFLCKDVNEQRFCELVKQLLGDPNVSSTRAAASN